ncbi:MAG: P-loop NTPase [Spirochaetaceae bacterium]|nr:MAG: P-loop NTPase [Spirochaetaceae bacterium]
MIDPRLDVIGRRLEPVKRIIAVSSAKGGVGKSVCAALISLALGQDGYRTGLLDLDFQGASAHLLLDVRLDFPEEQSGIKPLRAGDTSLDFMSFAAFSREHAVPLRGTEVSQAMLELLAITIWNPLDFLLIDMPPGIGDEIFDVLRYLRNPEFLVVTTPSRLVQHVVERLLAMLSELNVPLVGVIENMARSASASQAGRLADKYATPLLGSIPFVEGIDEILTRVARGASLPENLGSNVRSIAERIVAVDR